MKNSLKAETPVDDIIGCLTLLVCPDCQASLVRDDSGSLVCAVCPRKFERSKQDWFYYLYDGLSAQDRSLLVHMDLDRNPRLREFFENISRIQLRAVFASFDHTSVLDIGCGSSDAWRYFAGPFFYYGLEPSLVPECLQYSESPPDHVMHIHNDPARPLPVAAASFAMATYLASYDHIPNREEVLREVWDSLKIGGHLVVYMTNYGFWAKRLLNTVLRRQAVKHEQDHYCVHSPETLEAEVISVCPGARLVDCRADYFWIPNTSFSFLYKSDFILRLMNSTLHMFLRGILRRRNAGTVMICAFEKSA
jgi:SAM-dependent methyltransferase